jgi:Holliday junction resolvase RusA-like endonuclease
MLEIFIPVLSHCERGDKKTVTLARLSKGSITGVGRKYDVHAKYHRKFEKMLRDRIGTPEFCYMGAVEVNIELFFHPAPSINFFKKNGEKTKQFREWVISVPDADKVARCVLDALTVAGVYDDDRQVAKLSVQKKYDLTRTSGVNIRVYPIE